ncbi:hypothetical protein DEJ09_00300 [Curtobacterium sp. MCLR17_055]|nr:hypothetical protein DEJ09_00300 [Curtobacterium sp. MCLR17_055]
MAPVQETVEALARMYWDIIDTDNETSLDSLLTPIMHEQLPYAESMFEELARSLALFDIAVPGLDPVPWDEVLGLPLERALMSLFIINVGVLQDDGRFNASLVDEPQFRAALSPQARADVQATIRHLSGTPSQHQAAFRSAQERHPIAGRLSYNPLTTRPLVDLGPRGTLAPSAPLVPQALSTRSLYYLGMRRWENQFAIDLGRRVEALTGALLQQVPNAQAFPDTVWHPDGGKRTADWTLVTPTAVVVIECKSARPSIGALAGEAMTVASQHIVKARKQLDLTAQLIRDRNPAVAHIPTDRPIVGLVVTAEQFYLANSQLPSYGTSGQTPSMVVSLRGLELLTRLPASEIGSRLLGILEDERATWMLERALGDISQFERNPVLTAAWDRFTDVRNIASDAVLYERSLDPRFRLS